MPRTAAVAVPAKKPGPKPKPALAAPLLALATQGETVEQAAGRLLSTIRESHLRDLGAFDEAIRLAFEANGWNTRPGKPAKDRRAIPHTVRTYVWEIRSAYRAGVEVWRCKTMYEVRMARADAKRGTATTGTNGAEPEAEPLPPEVEQDLLGVRVVDAKRPNGALFHDLIATFIGLPADQRATFGRQLSRLLHTFQREVKVVGTPRAVAA